MSEGVMDGVSGRRRRSRETFGWSASVSHVAGRPSGGPSPDDPGLARTGSGSSLSERSGGAVPGSDRRLRLLLLLFWVNCGVIVDAVCPGTATSGNWGGGRG